MQRKVGAEIVGILPHSKAMREAVEHHHQRVDGSGYPDGLHGSRSAVGRIIGWRTLTPICSWSHRFQRPGPGAGARRVGKMSGTRFDGMLVRLLLRDSDGTGFEFWI